MSFRYTNDLLDNALTYTQYRQHITDTLTTAPADEKAQKMLPYYEKNAVLMDTFIAQYKVNNLMLEALRIAKPVTWLVLTEGWCGDAAFISPLLYHIEKAAHGRIRLRFVLKDRHPELMDAHLTNGGRSIPKLIVLDERLEELGSWGPRPEKLQEAVVQWKAAEVSLQELITKVHDWYVEDNTLSTQQELRNFIYDYSGRTKSIERIEEYNRLISSI